MTLAADEVGGDMCDDTGGGARNDVDGRWCDKNKEFNGLEAGVLNMSSYLITHEVLRQYMWQYMIEGYVKSSSVYNIWSGLDFLVPRQWGLCLMQADAVTVFNI